MEDHGALLSEPVVNYPRQSYTIYFIEKKSSTNDIWFGVLQVSGKNVANLNRSKKVPKAYTRTFASQKLVEY